MAHCTACICCSITLTISLALLVFCYLYTNDSSLPTDLENSFLFKYEHKNDENDPHKSLRLMNGEQATDFIKLSTMAPHELANSKQFFKNNLKHPQISSSLLFPLMNEEPSKNFDELWNFIRLQE